MKISVVGKSGMRMSGVKKDVINAGFELVDKNPQLVISYGGDGTLLVTERVFPGVPKLSIKNSLTCRKCHDVSLAMALEKIKNQEYEIEELIKLEASVNGEKKLICMNDLVIRNDVPTHALRFSVEVNERKHKHLIGDGVVMATPFGSTAYFNSITRREFTRGIGIGFNNLTKPKNHLQVKDDAVISIKIERRTGVLVADNNPKFVRIQAGDLITVKKSVEKGKIIKLI
ncbi:MAG: NAD(+)/NADH kinase [Nanoarchaeota archaeon]|nr:NAD(+)/NADH kinase [Nanoarchaeota archaeon]